MSYRVRPQRAEDAPVVRRVLTAAFADGGRVAELAEALRARPDTQAGLVAVDGRDEVVGCVHLSRSWVDAPDRLVEVLTLSPLAVAPAHQSRGVGTRLLAAAVVAAEGLGAPLLFLEGDPGYYAPRGWRPGGSLGFTPPSARVPPAAFQVVTLTGYDAALTGALVYNDTFWSRDCVGLRPGPSGVT